MRRGRKVGLWLLAAVMAAAAAAAMCAMTALRRPGWYKPASIDFTRLDQDKADAINLLDAISAALNRGESIDVSLSADQVNRWLAARFDIWPDSDMAALAPLERPLVEMLADGSVRVAATADVQGWRAVVSLLFRFEASAERLVVHWTGVRIGSLPLPRELVSGAIDRLVPSEAAPLRRFDGGVSRLENRWVWPNGKACFRVERLEVSGGRVEMRLSACGDSEE